jgi:hypothetical protein
MKSRCYNKNFPAYRFYGARGINVYEPWLMDFERFLADIGRRPSDDHSLDRIDTYGNYEPDNVRWATKDVQAANQRVRTDNKTGFKNIHYEKNSGRYILKVIRSKKVIYYASFKTLASARAALAGFVNV